MKALSLVAPALLGLVLGAACDLRQLVLESELLPGLRDEIVQGCCDCLASGQTLVAGDACSGEDLPPRDAGPLVENPCLCGGMTGGTCADVLIAGGIVDVVGGCTLPGGECEEACEGVLAYPP